MSNDLPLPLVIAQSSEDYEREIKATLTLIFEKYTGRLATLPKAKGWATENLFMYQGFWCESKFVTSVETIMASQESFQAHPSDIYLVTMPKSGTTWIKALAFAIMNRSRYQNDSFLTHPLLKMSPHRCIPLLETESFRSQPTYVESHSPRVYNTHTPYTSLPQSIIDCGCRLVYLYRNPKDLLVSFFHFANKLRQESIGLMTLEEAFEMFIKGVVPNGPYWDHVKGYYKISIEHPTRILFLSYENMISDTESNVKRLAEFLGYPFTMEEEANGVVQEIVQLCSFENLSEMNKHGTIIENVPNSIFFREGKVGDWSNHLTKEMGDILDQITLEKFHGLNISF